MQPARPVQHSQVIESYKRRTSYPIAENHIYEAPHRLDHVQIDGTAIFVGFLTAFLFLLFWCWISLTWIRMQQTRPVLLEARLRERARFSSQRPH
jgi:hypothetical protein